MQPGDRLYLVDGSGFVFRAYHALPALSRKSDGLPTGAVSGYCNMLWRLLEDMKDGDQPTHIAVVFDASKKTFRNAIYPEYKAHRPPLADDLASQFPLVRDATRAFNVSCVEEQGFEADDLIATYARQAREAGATVTIVSSDKDLMQLVEDGVAMLDPMKNRRIGSAEVIEKFGVPPSKVVDVQALAGDAADNVPGVPGIGVKTAAELIGRFGDLETLLCRADEVPQPKRRESLIRFADAARVSLRLVTLDRDAPTNVAIESFAIRELEADPLIGFLRLMEFNALTLRAEEHFAKTAVETATAASRTPTPAHVVYAWHTAALSGSKPPIHDLPQAGWYQRRLVKGGPFVAGEIWLDQAVDDSGELTEPERLRCLVDGKERDPADQWLWLCNNPISRDEFRFMTRTANWARVHAPSEPEANPKEAIDWNALPVPF